MAAATAGKIYTDTWRSTLAVELFESMLDEDFEPATPAEIRLLTEYARSLGPADKPDNQLSVADRALAAAERHDLMYEIVEGLDNKAIALGMEGRSYEARILMRAARDLAAEHGLYAPLRRATNNLAYLLGSDSVKEAVALGEEQLEQVMRNGDPVDILWSAGQVLGAYAFFGRWDRFDEVLAAARALDPPRLDEIRLEVAVNFRSMLQGDPEGGERSNRLLEEEYLSLQETEDVQTRSSLVVAAADFAFMNGRFEEAYEVAATARDGSSFMADVSVMQSAALALRDADKLRAIDAVIESRTFRGRRITWFRNINRGAMAAVAGDIEEAAATFEAVAAVVREHGAPREIAQTFPLLARLIGTDHPTGRALAREGYDTVMAAGFTTYLDLYADVLIPPEADEAADAAG